MEPGGKVEVDIANGWVRLRRGDTNLYISPHAVESILVEGGELAIS